MKCDNCNILHFENETGEGTITAYDIFPGVILAYNDFHMSYYDSEFVPDQADQILVVDNCKVVQKGTHSELIRQEGKYLDFIKVREQAEGWQLA